MVEVDTITIDNIEYIIVDDIMINGIRYIYLAEDNDPTKFMIRKIKIAEGNELLVNLDSDEEFYDALKVFNQKNHK